MCHKACGTGSTANSELSFVRRIQRSHKLSKNGNIVNTCQMTERYLNATTKVTLEKELNYVCGRGNQKGVDCERVQSGGKRVTWAWRDSCHTWCGASLGLTVLTRVAGGCWGCCIHALCMIMHSPVQPHCFLHSPVFLTGKITPKKMQNLLTFK